MIANIDDIKIIKLPHHFEDNGDLVVIEGLVNVPFLIARVFVVRAPNGAVRGQHAHLQCSQFLTCPTGIVEVSCDDGSRRATFTLYHPNIGLLVPPGIWAQQTYKGEGVALTVLCDRPYEPMDYIRIYDDFLVYRSKSI